MGTRSDKFPWELLKAECLRLVCTQLVEASSEGQKSFKPARKEDMITFLRDVHERGGKAQPFFSPPQPKRLLTLVVLSHQSFGRSRKENN